MVVSLEKLVKKIVAPLAKDDYPVLNTQLFVKIWLEYVLDRSVVSMRSLFSRMRHGGYQVDISTFSKASKKRDVQTFAKIYEQLNRMVREALSSTQERASANRCNDYQLNEQPAVEAKISLGQVICWNKDR